jgi:hypothetical protein
MRAPNLSPVRAELASAPDPLRLAVRPATQRILIDNAVRAGGWLWASAEQSGQVTANELGYLPQSVVDALGDQRS